MALASTGKASVRKRKMPAKQVVWLVIDLALYRHQSMALVVADLDLVLPDKVNSYIVLSRRQIRTGKESGHGGSPVSFLCSQYNPFAGTGLSAQALA